MNATRIEKLSVSAYKIPTDELESDGTYQWDSTTIVIGKPKRAINLR